ncbi:MAG: 4Fe-4S binding protein, partial [Clostridia bacterium]|nr:4Fe-4S binding protein [Clostridia bacterium]
AAPNTSAAALPEPPALPIRPPVLCAGCPHRASFYAVKQAMKGKKAFFAGDIGCYTLGNAMSLDMCDTCLCMGAGVNIAQGIRRMDPGTVSFAFVGDSTFFASGIPGVVNAVYNQADMTLVILDNSTTAMTGHQPHPGTGRTMMGEVVEKIDPVKVLEGIGVTEVVCLDPLDLSTAVPEVQRVSALPGVKAILFRSPCIALFKPTAYCEVDRDECIRCQRCIKELGCPALSLVDGNVVIDKGTCTGCGLCNQVCPKQCIGGVER